MHPADRPRRNGNALQAHHRRRGTMTRPKIGFVGIGLMGHGIAKSLVANGYALALKLHRNRASAQDLLAAGATEAVRHTALARESDVVILCVTGAPEVEEVVFGADGLASGAKAGLVIVDTST
ncbi:MAG TPA: NAD(P)-binding domain-containing protein, partial [Casimicrobiaceae bacterium]|nr:NAD(P)-binding domain-containing protein [Casimicrobiaceae bacterium]